jgi:hypothetical protein
MQYRDSRQDAIDDRQHFCCRACLRADENGGGEAKMSMKDMWTENSICRYVWASKRLSTKYQ